MMSMDSHHISIGKQAHSDRIGEPRQPSATTNPRTSISVSRQPLKTNPDLLVQHTTKDQQHKITGKEKGETRTAKYDIHQPTRLAYSFAPAGPGLTVVTYTASAPNVLARHAVERLMLKGGGRIGVSKNDASHLVSVISANHRHLEQAKALEPEWKAGTHEYKCLNYGAELDWCSIAGLEVLCQIIDDAKSIVTIEQPSSCLLTDDKIINLLRIHTEAEERGRRVLLFLSSCSRMINANQFHGVCADRIVVNVCEPEPNAICALSIEYSYLQHLHIFGIGKAMCSIIEANGQLDFRYSHFVADSLETRTMWLLRAQGMTLEQIGLTLKKDKSTIQRRLQGLPPVPKHPLSQERIQPYLDIFQPTV